ncbi:histidine kinase dimerization/phospho-acceptor domain-containing protein [Alcaligenaceae bacterium C4P045]|nr:histidine kinase dimerization/phospho-acceptor domain-containing protein [Alcaligenaceae bacterium C4P045]
MTVRPVRAFKPFGTTSIRRTLLLWLALGLSCGIVLAGTALYFQARAEADALFDYQLKQISASLPREAFAPIAPARQGGIAAGEDILIQIWDNNGSVIYRSHSRMALPQRAELGFANVPRDDGMWRIYAAQIGNTVVQIGQPQSARQAVAAQMAIKTVAPLLLFFPILGIIIWIAVGRGLAPVRRAAAEVQARDADQLEAISERGLPTEIQPLMHALNDLLARLQDAMQAQRAFVADAAHELRTPLTALRLQAQVAERAQAPEAREAAFEQLRRGIDRSSHLLQQLLILARQEPGASDEHAASIAVVPIVQEAIADFAAVADAQGIDLGVIDHTPVFVRGNAAALRILLGTLIDNALHYTPRGGVVDIFVREEADGCVVGIQDGGPGIDEADRARVFDRFYRAPSAHLHHANGSGLGLTIAQRIADAHGARIELSNTESGLLALVRLPRTL